MAKKENGRLFRHDPSLASPAREGQPQLEVGKRRDREEALLRSVPGKDAGEYSSSRSQQSTCPGI